MSIIDVCTKNPCGVTRHVGLKPDLPSNGKSGFKGQIQGETKRLHRFFKSVQPCIALGRINQAATLMMVPVFWPLVFTVGLTCSG